MDLFEILQKALDMGASDIFIVAGFPLAYKIKGSIISVTEEKLTPEDTSKLIYAIYEKDNNRSIKKLKNNGDDDFSFSISGMGRFRCSSYKQRGSLCAVLRVVAFVLPDYKELGIPDAVINLSEKRKGLVLITGPAGSGKSTTLASIINEINKKFVGHIITIEDPIEFLHKHNKSIISQREVNHDTLDYAHALRAALRQAPNVILLGEMRDYETTNIAMTAAETGQLVLSTLHTIGAAKTIDRIIDVFPHEQQQQIKVQLSMVLQAVVSQQLIPCIDGNVIPVFEIMNVNSAIRNLIREGKVHQIDNVILSGGNEGMVTMDSSLINLYNSKIISKDTAILYSSDMEFVKARI